jgi:16S rRNA (guanine527-N7)-methyltransferase
MELIRKYFPDLTEWQIRTFEMLLEIVPRLNQRVNVISRKDIVYLEERHILHSLSIAMKFRFESGTRVVDAGTGGGFPGIPLAILFPETTFTLVDSIGKKINLVREITHTLKLKNITLLNERIERVKLKTDFVVSRAVTAFPVLYKWTRHIIVPGHQYSMPNGLISLKGGDLQKELSQFTESVLQFPLSTWFDEPFFYSKMIVYLKK